MFEFRRYGVLTDGEVDLSVAQVYPANPAQGRVPSCTFGIARHGRDEQIGGINLRIGDTEMLRMYFGQIGYGVDDPYRGHRYAAKACLLLKPVALDYGMNELWITCNPDNIASRRTCEIIGCEFVEIVDLPKYTESYQQGERQKCRYLWKIKGDGSLETHPERNDLWIHR